MDIRDPDDSNFNFGYPITLLSFVLFQFNTLCMLPNIVPDDINVTMQKNWKWRNTVNSLIHSIITGVGATLCLSYIPGLRVDLINKYTQISLTFTGITTGYFIYDFIDLLLNNRKKDSTVELLIHHFVVTMCFGLAVITRRYQGYALVALLVEVNSIFLHIRQLCILHDVSKRSYGYRTICFLNIFTFIVFRAIPLFWQTYWLYLHMQQIDYYIVILGFTTNTIVLILNAGLLFQILRKDYFPLLAN